MNDRWFIFILSLFFFLFFVGWVVAAYGVQQEQIKECKTKCGQLGYDYWDIEPMSHCECLTKDKERIIIER